MKHRRGPNDGNQTNLNLFGSVVDKQLYQYDPGIECTESEVAQYLTTFNRLRALRTVASFSARLFKAFHDQNRPQFEVVDGVPITEDIILDATLLILKHCPITAVGILSKKNALLLFRMCYKLADSAFANGTSDANEVLMKIGYRQFPSQENTFNLLARNIFIYLHLWNTVDKANKLDVLSSIARITGLSYENTIALTVVLTQREEGYFFPYDKETISDVAFGLGKDFNQADYAKYWQWCSGDYSEYQEDQLINPLVLHPIIDTQEKPEGSRGNAVIVASYLSLFRKITSGMYFSLIDEFNLGEARNEFKEKFGYVFETYIGQLLKEHLRNWLIIPEIRYKKGRDEIDSVDWFALREDKLLMVEVKQSAIFVSAKQTASLDSIKNDLKKTLIKAAKQLERTTDDVQSKKYPELSCFSNVTKMQYLIVTNDPLYHANYIGKRLIKDEIGSLKIEFDIINISDLEDLLSHQEETDSFYSLLEDKRHHYGDMDFKEFVLRMFPNRRAPMRFLMKYYKDFFGRFKQAVCFRHACVKCSPKVR